VTADSRSFPLVLAREWHGVCRSLAAKVACGIVDLVSSKAARRSRPVQTLVSQGNRVNIALPFSVARAEEPTTIRARDWISLAGLVVSAVGFSVVIRELTRIARATERGQVSHQVSVDEAASVSAGSTGSAATPS
jgi:hypothetical protein